MQAKMTKITAATITMQISSPDNNGGTAITGYIGEYKDVSSNEWLIKKWNAVSDSFILEGLTPGNEYDFRFAAQNIVGEFLLYEFDISIFVPSIILCLCSSARHFTLIASLHRG